MHPNIAERIAYGRPAELAVEMPRPLIARPATALIGRILIAAIFILSGSAKLFDAAGSAGYMTQVGIPNADVLVYVAGVAEVLGGLSIALGLLTRVGALGLSIFLVIATLVFHDFWNLTGAEAKTQLVNFMKNLALLGGLLMLVAFGPGRYSLDARLRHPLQA